MTDKDNSLSAEARWAAATDSLRSVVKWIAAAFGGLGALLIGTVPLAGLNHLDTWTARIVPMFFGVTSLVAVGVIVWTASSLLTPSTLTLEDVRLQPQFIGLRMQVASDPTAYLGLWGSDIETFLERRATGFAALNNADRILGGLAKDDPRAKTVEEARPLLVDSVKACGEVSTGLLAIAGFHDLSHRFKGARTTIFIAAAVVVVGVVGFLVSTHSEAGASAAGPSAVDAPRLALITLTRLGSEELGPALGPSCPRPFKAILVSGKAEGPWQLDVTDPACTNGAVSVDEQQATVMSLFP